MNQQDCPESELVSARPAESGDLQIAPSRHGNPATSVIVVEDPAQLSRWIPAWEELAANALEPNIFYEHWMLLPALEAYGRGKDICFVLVLVHDPHATDQSRLPGAVEPPARLGALFPLEWRTRFRGLPFRHLALWQHLHCFLCTPLLDRQHARACLAAFLDWLSGSSRKTRVMEWVDVAADGPFFDLLTGLLHETGRPLFYSERQERALLRPRAGGDAYLEESLPGKSRKEFRRLERRLAETGPVDYVEFGASDTLQPWIDEMLAMEVTGWKGRHGTALGSTEAGRRFFTRVVTAAASSGRLMMLGLRAEGRFVAMKVNLLAGDGSFAFKIAFDERYRRYSPGTLLEIENIRRFHALTGVRWMDSCADSEHFMANRLWLDRRKLVTLVTAAGGLLHRAFVSCLPLLTRMSHAFRRPPVQAGGAAATESQGGRMKDDHALLDLDASAFREHFGRRPFLVRHNLAQHELFTLPRLIELSRRLPASSVEYNAGDIPVSIDPAQTPRTGLSVEETLRRIAECRSWMVLKHVEQDPAYRDLLERCLAEVGGLTEQFSPGMSEKVGFIFVSSPGSVTPYHMDPEENFLLQVRGRKTMSLFDRDDRSIVTDQEIERFLSGAHRNLVLRDGTLAKARAYELTPGLGVHVPMTSPHWVKNGDEVSISFSITFQTRASMRRGHTHRMNAELRKWGVTPGPVGRSRLVDTAKQLAYRVKTRLARILGIGAAEQSPGY